MSTRQFFNRTLVLLLLTVALLPGCSVKRFGGAGELSPAERVTITNGRHLVEKYRSWLGIEIHRYIQTAIQRVDGIPTTAERIELRPGKHIIMFVAYSTSGGGGRLVGGDFCTLSFYAEPGLHYESYAEPYSFGYIGTVREKDTGKIVGQCK